MAIDMKAIHDSQRTLVMGVLNITEDSFSDGGLWLAPEAAKAHGEAMMKAGADIIDIGAESTRPGAKRVSEADEKARVLGAVDALIPEGAVLSIDTTRASVALAALEHGAQIINDVSGGQLDRELPHVVADHSDCLYIVQHWRGWLAGAAGNVPDADTSRYEHGVVNDVYDELMRQVDAVLEAGVQAEQVIIDPGLGFSKPGGWLSGADRRVPQTFRRLAACRRRCDRAGHGLKRQRHRGHQRPVRGTWRVGRARA